MGEKRTVAIVPHMDDEALGLAGMILANRVDRIVYVTDSAVRWRETRPSVGVATYHSEKVAEARLLCQEHDIEPVFLDWPNEYLVKLRGDQRIALVESIVEAIKGFDILLLPSPLDAHVEHALVYAAGAYARTTQKMGVYSITEETNFRPVEWVDRPHQLIGMYYAEEWARLVVDGYPLRDHDTIRWIT